MKRNGYFFNMTYRKKLYFSYFIVLLIPIIIFGLFTLKLFDRMNYNQLVSSLNEQVDDRTNMVNKRLSQAVEELYSFTYDQRILSALQNDYSDLYPFVEQYTNVIVPAYNVRHNLDNSLTGWHLYTNGSLKEYRNVASPLEAFLGGSANDSFNLYKGIFWRIEGQQLHLCIYQTPAYNTNLINIIQFTYEAALVFEGIELPSYPSNMWISNSDGTEVYGSAIQTDDPLQGPSYVETRHDGHSVLVFTRSLPVNNWKIHYSIPSGQLTNGSGSYAIALVVISVLLIVLLINIWIILSKLVITRVERLNRTVQSIERAVSYASIDTNELKTLSSDEIGVLSNSIYKLVEKIQTLTQEKIENEIAALQSQVKPHFLYNSLSLIHWSAVRTDNAEISDIAVNLAKFYRSMLNSGGTFIKVREEWANVEAYLKIQQIFHNNHLNIIMQMHPEATDVYMPHFTIQLLVENAIVHGIDRRESKEGTLRILCATEREMIVWTVEDDGPGFAQADPLELLERDSSNHYGLYNMNKRLGILYGSDYQIALSNRREGGARVVLRLKIRRQGEDSPVIHTHALISPDKLGD